MDVSQYLEIFIEETKEHLQDLSQNLMVLEEEPENPEVINEIFRAAHSLKGMAGTMGFKRMQHLTHIMENALSEIRNGKMMVTGELVDILFKCLDALEEYLESITNTTNEGNNDNEHIIILLNNFLEGGDVNTSEEKVVDEENPDGGKTIIYNEYDVDAVEQALLKDLNVFEIHVTVEESCILKAARAFLVFKSIEEAGEIIKSVPGVQDIEDEKFDLDFSLLVVSSNDMNKVIESVKNVSEIKEVVGKIITEAPKADILSEHKDEKSDNTEKEVKEEKKAEVVKTSTEISKNDNKAPAKTTSKPVVNRSVRVDIEKLDVLMNLVSELIIAKNGLVSVSNNEDEKKEHGFNEQIEYLERVTTKLHESVMNVRMMPIETVTQKFPKMVRDLSKKLDKQMKLFIYGEDTELDRTVIDEIGDPLMHLLRNSADHGLESPEMRTQRGKDPVGTIILNAYQDGNNVVIEVKDDGNGINVETVKQKAIEKGAITEEQAETMSNKDIIDLLFKPSFSMAKVVSDVSGRGVGLDVVKTKIEALGGDIEVKTKLGEGSTFIIRLPLTLAIIQALMVEIGSEKYAISLGSIQTIEDVQYEEIKYVQSREVINLRGSVIPIIRLDSILEIEKDEDMEKPESLTVVIIKKGEKHAGFVVDSLIGQQEIVIKSLGKYINNGNNIIGGATILGDGEVALILDVNTLV
jgi:two-component system chemotaxis sensor kinase CheA